MSHRFHTAISIVIGTLLALLAFGTNNALAQPSKGGAAQKAQVKVTVRGGGGQPVANARVSASGPGGTQQATSDAQGVATLTLPSGIFSLQATAATFAKPATGTVSVPQQQAVTIAFPASPVPFVVTVVDGENKPVAGASVRITTAANEALAGTTGSDGRAQFSVSRGAAKSVGVTKAGYLAGNASGVQIGAQGGAVQVVLKAAEIAYTLTVRGESGKPVPGARALVTSVKGMVVFQGTADASGVITLRQPSGGYTAAISAAGFQPQNFGPFGIAQVGSRGSTVTLKSLGNLLRVTVRGGGGQPVANARVSASGPGGTQQATSDAQGVATLTLPSGIFSLQATAATFAKPATGTVSVPQQQAVTIAFPASPVPFVVTVVDGENKPVAGASVRITTAANEALAGTTGSDGRAQFSVSRGAAKSVGVTKAGYLAGNASGVQIGAQGGAVQVVLKAAEIAYTLTVRDESGKPVPGARALVSSVKGTVVFQGTADASGVITLRQPRGGYKAALSAAGFKPREFGPFSISELGLRGEVVTLYFQTPPPPPLVSGLGAKLTIKVGDGASPSISGGVPPYSYVSENPGIVTISLHRAGDFQINGVAPGTTRVVLRDSSGQQFISTVVVKPSLQQPLTPPPLASSLPANETLKVGIGAGFTIIGGVPPYSCDSENPGIVKAFRVGNDVKAGYFQINGVAPGTTRVVMRDSRGQQIIVTVVVQK